MYAFVEIYRLDGNAVDNSEVISVAPCPFS